MTDVQTLELSTDHYTVSVRFVNSWAPERKTRVYSSADMSDVETPEPSIKGENAELDKAWRRYNKEEVKRMKAVVMDAMEELAKIGDSTSDSVRMADWIYSGGPRFSRKAGCACGCSAGFIVDGVVRYGWKRVSDVFISKNS